MTSRYRRFEYRKRPQDFASGLERVMKHMNAPRSNVVEIIFANWESIVGEMVAAHTTPSRITDGNLHLTVEEPAWASEMSWMAQELLQKIEAATGSKEITSITVSVK